MDSRYILGMRVDAGTYMTAIRRIVDWATKGESRYVSIATVNNVMESYDDSAFQNIMNEADMVTSDGMPLVWGLRALGLKKAERVYGPDLMPMMLGAAEVEGIPVGFYGADAGTLDKIQELSKRRWPNLLAPYWHSPPFRPLTDEEDLRVIEEIRRSGARILFIGLSTPKQERWMAGHRGRINAVMLGVGAAFDFLAGTKAQAPRWMMRWGLEWLFRLATEPRRLWRRYLKHNPRFVFQFWLQLMGLKAFPAKIPPRSN